MAYVTIVRCGWSDFGKGYAFLKYFSPSAAFWHLCRADMTSAQWLEVDGVVAIDSEEEILQLHDLDAISDTIGGATIQRLFATLLREANTPTL